MNIRTIANVGFGAVVALLALGAMGCAAETGEEQETGKRPDTISVETPPARPRPEPAVAADDGQFETGGTAAARADAPSAPRAPKLQ